MFSNRYTGWEGRYIGIEHLSKFSKKIIRTKPLVIKTQIVHDSQFRSAFSPYAFPAGFTSFHIKALLSRNVTNQCVDEKRERFYNISGY